MKRMMILALGLAMGMSFSVSAFAAEETGASVETEEIITTYDDGQTISDGEETTGEETTGEEGTGFEEKTYESNWRPNWMDAEKNSAEEAVIREYSSSDTAQDPLSYLLDNYNCNLDIKENIYTVVPKKIYILKKNTPAGYFDEFDSLELVIVNRVYEADRIFGTKRTADITLISTGQRLNVPIGDSTIAVYSLHKIYKVKDPRYSQNIRDLLEWER